MRASLLVPGALALALAGCKGASQKAPPREEMASIEPPASSAAPLEGVLDDAADPSAASSVAPEADGWLAASVPKDSPNMRYARLGRDACLAELGRRAIAFEEAPPAEWAQKSPTPMTRLDTPAKKAKHAVGVRKATGAKSAKPAKPTKHGKQGKAAGPTKAVKHARSAHRATAPVSTTDIEPTTETQILAPVRLRGPLHGITIRSSLPERARAKSPFEIFDCRLVLALDDFASLLAQHDVVEVVHMSAFRSQRDRGCMPNKPGKQHCGALAVDIGRFKKSDGSVLDVEKDWSGRIGAPTCTPGAGPNPVTPSATELWDIVCESARRGLFHVMLTPNFNAEHKNHFHLEVTPDVGWMLLK